MWWKSACGHEAGNEEVVSCFAPSYDKKKFELTGMRKKLDRRTNLAEISSYPTQL